MEIKAAVVHGKGEPFKLEKVTLAEPQMGEVLVRIVASGICRTDIGAQLQEKNVPLPAILGHEGAGVVEKVGPGVTTFKPGDHVVMSYSYCGTCKNCLKGKEYACDYAYEVNFGGAMPDGTHRHFIDGQHVSIFFGQSSLATYSVVSADNLVKVDPEVPLELLGPLGCGIQTGSGTIFNKLKPELGSTLAVFGCGTVGLSAIMAAKLAGCRMVIGVDIHDSRLELAQQLGATHVINARHTDVVQTIKELTGGGLDYGVDCSGSPQVLRQATDSLAVGGTVALVGGTSTDTEVTLNMNKLLFDKTVSGVVQGNSIPKLFIPQLIELYKQGRFPFDKLLTFYDFDQINQAVEDMKSGKVIKPVIRIGSV